LGAASAKSGGGKIMDNGRQLSLATGNGSTSSIQQDARRLMLHGRW
jgi:hypothetical protein